MLNVTRLLVSRGASAPGVLMAAALAATVAAAMLVGFTSLAPKVAEDAFRQVLDAGAAGETTLVARSGLRPSGWQHTDAGVRRLASAQADNVPNTVRAAGWGTAFKGPGLDDNVRVQTGFIDDLPDHARLVSGQWPQPGGEPLEVAVHRDALDHLGAAVGDIVPLESLSGDQLLAATIVGAWQPVAPEDPLWGGLGNGFRPGDEDSVSLVGPLVADRTDVLTRVPVRAGSSIWTIDTDVSTVTTASAAATRGSIQDLSHELTRLLSSARDGTEIYTSGGAAPLVLRAEAAARTAGSLLGTVTLQLGVLAAVALWFTVRLLAQQRAPATALLRVRGASTPRLVAWAVLGAVLPGIVVAAGGTTLAGLPGGSWTETSTADTGRLVAVVVALAWITLMGVAEVRAAPSVSAVRRNSSRPDRGLARRAGADVILIGLGLVALQQLYRPQPADVVLVVAPTLVVFAGAVATLRALPYLARLASSWSVRSKALGSALATWEVSRRPAGHLASGLLVVLAISVAMLSATTLSTWQGQRDDVIDFVEPADLRVAWTGGPLSPDTADHVLSDLTGLPGVTAVTPIWRWEAVLPGTKAAVLGLDPTTSGRVMRWRPDLAGAPVPELLSTLADRSARSGVPAIFTSALAAELGAQPGEVLTLAVDGLDIPVEVVTIVDAIPGVDTATAALVDGRQLATRSLVEKTNQRPGAAPRTAQSKPPPLQPEPPREWWLAKTGDEASMTQHLGAEPGLSVVGQRSELIKQAKYDSTATSISTALLSGFWAASVLVVIGIGAHTVARSRSRRGEVALLRALGITARESTRRLFVEQLLALGLAGAAGIMLGLGVAALVIPNVVNGLAGLPDLPPIRLVISWRLVAGASGAVLALILGVTALQAAAARSVSVADTLRKDEQA